MSAIKQGTKALNLFILVSLVCFFFFSLYLFQALSLCKRTSPQLAPKRNVIRVLLLQDLEITNILDKN